ncbi:MAG: hypothetical protein HIU92_06570 [Proteobacteria bacterium]|nr:hypothetical protein [Pseudomonadota bacterium]
MSTVDLRRGWCPSLLRPMESGDGWLVRVRPRAGVIPAVTARAVAEAAEAHGNGRIEVTNRANLQVRGLRPETVAPFAAAMEAAGVADEGPAMLVSPLLGADPTVAHATSAIIASIAHDITLQKSNVLKSLPVDSRQLSDAGVGEGYPLPAKFGFLIDGGGVLPLTGLALDVTLRVVDGSWFLNGAPVPTEAAAARAVALAHALAQEPRRVAPRTAKAPALGFHRYGGGATGAVLLAPPFGQMEAAQLAALADLADRWGDGMIRPTPWKSLAIAGVAVADEGSLRDRAARDGLIADPADPRLGIVTCAGAPACLRGTVETHKAALALAAIRREGEALIHLSGCAKGCAHPASAPVTLVGEAGRFDLVRDGRPGDPPAARGLTLAQAAGLMQSVPA